MGTVNKEEKNEFPNRPNVLFDSKHDYSTSKKSSLLKINFILLFQIFYLGFQTLE